jgi:hypothetical protein
MRPEFALWAVGAFVLLFLMWIDAPWSVWILVSLALAIIDWVAKRWVFPRKPEPKRILPNRRLLTGLIGAVLGASVGVGIGLFMQSDAHTLKWLAILLGSLGFVFGVVFKLTL